MLDKDKSILIVDDIEPSRETVVNFLRVLGYQKTREAADGKEALEILEHSHDIQLVISDWKMPRMNGAELLRCMRSSSRWEDLPFIFLTSRSESEDVAEASELGVTEYMVKPLSIEVLSEKMSTVSTENPRQKLYNVLKEVKHDCALNNFSLAVKRLSDLLEQTPSMKARIYYETARVYYQAGETSQAREMVDQALSHNHLLGKAWHLKAELEKNEQAWEEARASLDKALAIQPRSVDFYLAQGDILLYMQDYYRARESFQRAINVSPEEDWIKRKIWEIYLKHDLCGQAEANFGSLVIDCLSSDVINNYAVALRKQGQKSRAVELYAVALKKDPDNPGLLFNAAVSDYYNGNFRRAVRRLQKALEEHPGFTQAEVFLKKLMKES
ncbi:response regulator [Desulfonatronospira sp.]|uniref:response regulator n=1 Tax=Desulfonatronospira sp. TaxID=1962951 RepID=UPI0025BDA3DA|nr:response regulator [Desulfonatronospira sp.]